MRSCCLYIIYLAVLFLISCNSSDSNTTTDGDTENDKLTENDEYDKEEDVATDNDGDEELDSIDTVEDMDEDLIDTDEMDLETTEENEIDNFEDNSEIEGEFDADGDMDNDGTELEEEKEESSEIMEVQCDDVDCGQVGTCVIEDGLAVCECDTGYTGEKCDDCDRAEGYRWTDGKTKCSYMPCPEYPCDEEDGQTCSDGRCICPWGEHWSSDGVSCTISACDPNYCFDIEHATGVCNETKNSSICECEQNYLWDDDDRVCFLDCEHQCFDVGATRCKSIADQTYSGYLETCKFKNDDCSEWVFKEDCPTGACQNNTVCAVCDNECDSIYSECNGDVLESCTKDEYGCFKYAEENCDLGCSDGECLSAFCGSGELEGLEYCDSDTISCSSICSDYSGEEKISCSDTCTHYDTSTCIQPTVELSYNLIEAGTFTMGMNFGMAEASHEVTLTNGFVMQNIKVTQQNYETLMGYNPSYFNECGPNCPVENISYFDAMLYANKLSIRDGYNPCISFSDIICDDGTEVENELECLAKGGIKNSLISLNSIDSIYLCNGYRLPTEAEWEYAASAGKPKFFFYNGHPLSIDYIEQYVYIEQLDLISWYGYNSIVNYNGGDSSCADYLQTPEVACGTHPVGLKQPNENCLYDITGNTFEWVFDLMDITQYDKINIDALIDPTNIEFVENGNDYVAIRGCSWKSVGWFCRVSSRSKYSYPMERHSDVGFRLVRTIVSE